MHLTDRERERLDIFATAELARRRLSRGCRLSAPEAVAVVCDEILERAWDGEDLGAIIEASRSLLGLEQLQPGVGALITHIQIDALFPSGTALVAVDHPFGPPQPGGPGAVKVLDGDIELNAGRERIVVEVQNTSDLPIYVSSHFPFAEVNPGLVFDRVAAQGHRLDIPAGTSQRFSPGETVPAALIDLERPTAHTEDQR